MLVEETGDHLRMILNFAPKTSALGIVFNLSSKLKRMFRAQNLIYGSMTVACEMSHVAASVARYMVCRVKSGQHLLRRCFLGYI